MACQPHFHSENIAMKALLLAAVAAVAGVSYVGYSYSSTDGKSCLVCPMTGEPVFTSSKAESEDGPCCAGGDIATLTSVSGEGSSCCKNAGSGCCANDEATLTSVSGSECPSQSGKSCCKDQAESAELTSVQEEPASESTEDVVADNTGT
jgi:hypothetical protein